MGILKEMVAIGAYYVESGVSDFDSWSKLMIDDLGPNVRPCLKDIMEWSVVMAHQRDNSSHLKKNCWEYYKCGKLAESNHGKEFGGCPAYREIQLNGIHGGKNGGRVCWIISGTKCGGRIKRTFIPKSMVCKFCDFKKIVIHEERHNFIVSDEFMKMLIH